jgi:hypothetical protein
MKHMIDLREDCLRHLVEFRKLRKVFKKDIKDCENVIGEKEESKLKANEHERTKMQKMMQRLVNKKIQENQPKAPKATVPRLSRAAGSKLAPK